MKRLFVLIILVMKGHILIAQSGADSEIGLCTADIDSLKWKFYALTFDVHLRKYVNQPGPLYKVIEDSAFFPAQCEVGIVRTEMQGDTTLYFLDFNEGSLSDRYVQQKANCYVAIGFLKNSCVYFALPGEAAFNTSLSFHASLFKKREALLIDYLRKYRGPINLWLREAAVKKGVIN